MKFLQKLRSRGPRVSLSRIPRCSPTQMEARMRARTRVRPASVASSSRSSGVVGVDVDHVLELGVPRGERVYGQAGQTGIRIEKMADEYVA